MKQNRHYVRTMLQGTRRRRRVVTALALVPALLIAACGDKRRAVPVQEVFVSGTTLRLNVGTCHGNPTATAVETDTQVRIKVMSTIGSGDACMDSVSVTLRQPLGSRSILDRVNQRTLTVGR